MYYAPIQEALNKNKNIIRHIEKYKWVQEMDLERFNDMPLKKIRRNIIGRNVIKVIKKLGGYGKR